MAEILLGKLLGPGGFERPVVVKRVLPHLARQREFRDMFLDEARIQARIRHPNVVHVDELGEEGSELYMVMEYLAGESVAGLNKRLAQSGERLPQEVAAHVIAEALAGLHAAHELVHEDGMSLGLVHRDVSPQNVFVTYDGQIKVLDFGIAKFLDRSVETSTGHMKGKFAYMSPEQCRNETLDRRSDLFSIAIVLWELLAEQRLFQRGNEMLVWKSIVDDPIPTPSSRLPEGTAPIAPQLEAIVMRTLSRIASERPATDAELRRDLLAVLRDIDPLGTAPEKLVGVMGRVFGDRIGEKKELLRRVRAGDEVTSIPSAEVDIEIRVEETQLAVATDAPAAPRKRTPLWVAGGIVTVVLIATAAMAFGGTPAPPPSAPPVVPELAHEEPPPPTTVVAVAAPTNVTVQIESTPTGAAVVGPDGAPLGVTPCSVSLPQGTEAVALRVTLDGYREHVETVTPDMSQRVRFTLSRERRTHDAPAVPPPSGDHPPEFFRFD
jgi:serine/threonine-protein kinase